MVMYKDLYPKDKVSMIIVVWTRKTNFYWKLIVESDLWTWKKKFYPLFFLSQI